MRVVTTADEAFDALWELGGERPVRIEFEWDETIDGDYCPDADRLSEKFRATRKAHDVLAARAESAESRVRELEAALAERETAR